MQVFFSQTVFGKFTVAKVLFILMMAIIVILNLAPHWALLIGLILGIIVGNPYQSMTKKYTKYLLQISVVGLGFGMDINKVLEAGANGIFYTMGTIILTLIIGTMIGKLLKVNKTTSYLITAGTAICGGSAIAAVSPVIKADDEQISVSIGTVFILNAVALFIFPPIGHYLGLTQQQFGIWCAIAIHDTSSVVGASSSYGHEAMIIATTVKLARALWIVPLVIVSSFLFKNEDRKASFPLFILFFLIASVMKTYVPIVADHAAQLLAISKAGLSITLFFIGAGINIKSIRAIGARPMLQGVILWVLIMVSSLWVIKIFLG